MTWAFFIDSREAMLRVVIFWSTLLSPMMEKSLDNDIVEADAE